MIEEIKYGSTVYAYVVRNENPQSTKFYTPKDYELQMGLVTHKKGYVEPAHLHKRNYRVIEDTTETLYVIKGSCYINFFDINGKKLGRTKLTKGDSILLVGRTGHNLETITDFKGFKTKQGPYIDVDEDKVLL